MLRKRLWKDPQTTHISFAFSAFRGALAGVQESAEVICSEYPAFDRSRVLKETLFFHLNAVEIGHVRMQDGGANTKRTTAFQLIVGFVCHTHRDPALPAMKTGALVKEAEQEMESLRKHDAAMFHFIHHDLKHAWNIDDWDARRMSFLRIMKEAPTKAGFDKFFGKPPATSEERARFDDALKDTQIIAGVGVAQDMFAHLGVEASVEFAMLFGIIANALTEETVSHIVRYDIS